MINHQYSIAVRHSTYDEATCIQILFGLPNRFTMKDLSKNGIINETAIPIKSDVTHILCVSMNNSRPVGSIKVIPEIKP